MEKKKGKKGVVAGAVGGALAAILLLGGGLGLGSGGEGSVPAMNEAASAEPAPAVTPAPETTPAPTPSPVPEAKTVRIEARQDQYFIDGTEVSLGEIEALITAEENADFVLEDHYASAKAWDELKALFTKYEVAVREG